MMKAQIIGLAAVAAFFLAVAAYAAPEDARFCGGSYDGADGQASAEYSALTPVPKGTTFSF